MVSSMWFNILVLAIWPLLQFCTAQLPYNQFLNSAAPVPYNQVQIASAPVPYNQVQWTPYTLGFQYVPPSWTNKLKPQLCRMCSQSSRNSRNGYDIDMIGYDTVLRFLFPQVLPCCEPVQCECGKTRTRIIGGTETAVNQYPWIVLLSVWIGGKTTRCGGSLIADKWILTAAHCVDGVTKPKHVTITLGEHDTSKKYETTLTKVITPDLIINHPDYVLNGGVASNDISLLRLRSREDLTTYTPVCLPSTGADYTGKRAWVYGWGIYFLTPGQEDNSNNTSDILLNVEVPVVSDDAAKTTWASVGEGLDLTDAELAATIFAGGEIGKSTCGGDSGGPLSYDNNGKHEQIGVVSWGNKYCGTNEGPSGFADVAVLRSWIDSQMATNGGASLCST